MPLRPKELEERMRTCGHESETFLFVHSEVTKVLPAHRLLDITLEKSQEAGGNLNLPKLIKSLNRVRLVDGTMFSFSHFSVVGTSKLSQSSYRN